tara:strand:+ start:1914 stop:2480 length:567 start_codon:yes stop_codon:yes gene_type:complete
MNKREQIHICMPNSDPKKRFVLAKKGINNLLAICLNPSTANEFEHDGTSRNIEKIAEVNGFDGWALFNLSPERTPKPELLNVNDDELMCKNTEELAHFLNKNEFQIKDVLLAWGNNVGIGQFAYLKKSALRMFQVFNDMQLNYWCIKLTNKKHPFHPSLRYINRYIGKVEEIRLIPFEVEKYLTLLNE